MSIQLRQTADAMIADAMAMTGRATHGSDERSLGRFDRAAEREARFFGFRREARVDAAPVRVSAIRDRAMA